MEINKCKKCKHEWTPRVEDPIECPECKSRNWKEYKIKKEEIK